MKVTIKGTRTQEFKLILEEGDDILDEMLEVADCNGMNLEDVIEDYYEDGMLDDYIDTYSKNDYDYALDGILVEGAESND